MLYIATLIIVLLYIIQVRCYNNLCKHLQKHYPNEWRALSKNTLGGDIEGNFEESLRSGFFSTLKDPKLQRFQKFKQINIIVCCIIGIAGVVLAYAY